MTYSVDFRKKVLAIKAKENLSFEATAKRFDISKSALQRWSKSIESKKTRVKKPTKIDMKALQKDIELYPDSYCQQRNKSDTVLSYSSGLKVTQSGQNF